MRRLLVLVLLLAGIVALSSFAAPVPAAALDLTQVPQNLGVALLNIPGSVANGVKGFVDEVDKRGVLSLVSGWPTGGLNVGVTAASSGLTLGTLGLVPPVKNAWSKDPPPVVLPK